MPSDKRLEEIRKDLQRGTRPWYDTDVEYLLSVLDAARQPEQWAQLGQMVMLLLQNDFEGARQLALEIPLAFPDGTPAAAPTETAASFARVGLEGCQVLEGAISEMFVHDKDCPAFNRPTETAAPQPSTPEGELISREAAIRRLDMALRSCVPASKQGHIRGIINDLLALPATPAAEQENIRALLNLKNELWENAEKECDELREALEECVDEIESILITAGWTMTRATRAKVERARKLIETNP